jgi:hypothetical protein
MGYNAYDMDDFLGQVASNGGWYSWAAWARGQGGALAELADKGCTEDIPALIEALTDKHPTDKGDRSVHAEILVAAKKAAGIFIVSDGLSGHPSEAE